MVLQQGNHQQPAERYDPMAIGLKISKTLIALDNLAIMKRIHNNNTSSTIFYSYYFRMGTSFKTGWI